MNLTSLPKIVAKPNRRIGRGHGSGRVKTSGRGTKGQKARENIKLTFAGSSLQASWLKRLPLKRGKGKNKSHQDKPLVVNLKYLNTLKPQTEVTLESLRAGGIITNQTNKVKILGDGELTVPLIVKLPCSKGAQAKIVKAGGRVSFEH
ncbi:MAG: 50S ribosomal protein L15 [Microgenomates group bacterium GW2011_GWA1_48_10]|uniref:Large ribosomal subunit protein uL15 n=1 Tax=Candidatus Gottesmanbacteria bacterium RIFCSPHIGHO2_01_FULL_47_48 TaxID=1798381 RepID=A0A1F6A2G7_9BACT|nr:MAG: 50S ribosomal protein L15 [Microgenomates group bacterium GW2011_GWA1_48_10]OGG18863.1 MAG: 50S ribosomal protein L15 [Candidatus Gottesmanbacteria bacterium RIFCSPHIGHO2_01_FULL_47_48]